jgi:hypothetical protein
MKLVLLVGMMAALTAGPTLVAQDGTLSKPLVRFTVGDIFPKLVTDSFADTGRRWSETSSGLLDVANERKRLVADALKSKKGELPAVKQQIKDAKSDKDFVTVGTLEGTLKDAQVVLEVLKKISALSQQQADVANGLEAVGAAMVKFTKADDEFDPFRGQRISRPAPGEPDQRLGADGYKAYKAQAQALAALGEAFSNLGAQVEALSSERMKVLSALEKGGHIQAPK